MSFSLGVWQALLATVYVADKVKMGKYDFVPTSRLAEDLNIPAPSLSRLLRSLGRAGIIETREGVKGGVRLAIPPERVSLLDVVSAIDGDSSLFRTDSTPRVSGSVPARRQKALREALATAEGSLQATLEGVTIDSISVS